MAKKLKITVEGREYIVEVEELSSSGVSLAPAIASSKTVTALPSSPAAPALAAPKKAAPPPASAGDVKAPMTGVIVEYLVSVGDKVKAGQQVATMEAMKMKTALNAVSDGVVTALNVDVGGTADGGQVIVSIGNEADVTPKAASAAVKKPGASSAGDVKAPMTGVLIEYLVKEGDRVTAGQQVATLEAMKMKTAMNAPKAGKVIGLYAEAGATVDAQQVILTVE